MGKNEARERGLILTLKQERDQGLREKQSPWNMSPLALENRPKTRPKYKKQDLTKRKKQDPATRKNGKYRKI